MQKGQSGEGPGMPGDGGGYSARVRRRAAGELGDGRLEQGPTQEGSGRPRPGISIFVQRVLAMPLKGFK